MLGRQEGGGCQGGRTDVTGVAWLGTKVDQLFAVSPLRLNSRFDQNSLYIGQKTTRGQRD